MQAEELTQFFNGPAGFLGPVGLTHNGRPLEDGLTVVVDKSLEDRKNLVAGANKLDYHLRNVTPGRDFTWTVAADIRSVNEGESCPQPTKTGFACAGKLLVGRAVEVGHIFQLGYKYTESMGARVLDENGKEVMPIMGCYGIGIERILTAAIEQSNDKNGFWLPASIAPFTVVVTVTNSSDAPLAETGQSLAAALDRAGLDVRRTWLAAFARRDEFLDFIAEQQEADLVVVADGGKGEHGCDLGGEFAFGLRARPKQAGAAHIHNEA